MYLFNILKIIGALSNSRLHCGTGRSTRYLDDNEFAAKLPLAQQILASRSIASQMVQRVLGRDPAEVIQQTIAV